MWPTTCASGGHTNCSPDGLGASGSAGRGLQSASTAHPGDVRLHAHLKELTGLLLQTVRTMHNESQRPSEPVEVLRYATRKERSAQNKAQWAEDKAIMRWLRMRHG